MIVLWHHTTHPLTVKILINQGIERLRYESLAQELSNVHLPSREVYSENWQHVMEASHSWDNPWSSNVSDNGTSTITAGILSGIADLPCSLKSHQHHGTALAAKAALFDPNH